MWQLRFIAALLPLAAATATPTRVAERQAGPVVNASVTIYPVTNPTTATEIYGTSQNGVDYYLGIPYAESRQSSSVNMFLEERSRRSGGEESLLAPSE